MAFLSHHPRAIRALLIDISGTLLIGSSPIPGAANALAKLRAAHIPFRLCSNTSKESSDAVHKRMREAGLDVRREELWTSIGALRTVLKEMGVKRPYMLLSQSALDECTEKPEVQSDHGVSNVPDSPASLLPHDAVVVGLAPSLLDYDHLNTAFRILIGEDRPRNGSASRTKPCKTQSDLKSEDQAESRPSVPLIALHEGLYLEASDHALSLGPGPFVLALEEVSRTSAKVVGKPTRAFFETVLRDLDRDLDAQHQGDDVAPLPSVNHDHDIDSPSHPGRWEGIAVIGDDVRADLGEGAVELGLWRVLVKTGKYRPGDEARTDEIPPDQVCATFADFVDALLEQRQTSIK